MPEFAAPVVALHGSTDPAAPLVVLLHGRGSSEQEIIGIAPHLPEGPAYAAVRAPIAEGGGYAWFANRGIGRPVASSLEATMGWFREWLDSVAPAGRPVVLVGFSGGAAFVGGLLLADPQRYAGAGILFGTLPWDAGVPTTPGRLFGTPVFVAQGDQDRVIPVELMERTWSYLLGESGAPAYARRDPGGHGLTAGTVRELAGWIGERLRFVLHRGTVGDVITSGALPPRAGARPDVTWQIPQTQVSDTAPVELQERLFTRIAALEGISTGPSAISVPGARGFFVPVPASAPADAYLVPSAGEFAHVHPDPDGSLHLALSLPLAREAIEKGWAQAHPFASVRLTPGMVLLYGPRDEAELEVVGSIVEASYRVATGA